MKKLILTAACTVMAAVSGYSQGTIAFQNTAFTQFYFNSTANTANKVTSGTIASQAPAGSTSTGVIDVGLYWSTAAFTDAAQGALIDTVTFGSTAGTILGATVPVNTAAYGASGFVQVFAWDSSYATPDAALAAGAYFGASSAGQVNTTYGAVGAAQAIVLGQASPAPGAPIFGTSGALFPRTILLQNVPEPTTLALGGLGAAALLMFRRRK